MTERTGRCMCGSVTFRLTADPVATRICWCRDCQHISGNGTVNSLVASDAIVVDGNIASFGKPADSGNQVSRQFCPTCGTQLFGISSGRPGFTVVRAGNLDDPSSVKPTMNIWTSSAPQWACLDPTIGNEQKQPPAPAKPADTRPEEKAAGKASIQWALLPIEPNDSVLLALANQENWLVCDADGNCSEAEWAWEAYGILYKESVHLLHSAGFKPSVPEGYFLLPVKPTEELLLKVAQVSSWGSPEERFQFVEGYLNMVRQSGGRYTSQTQ